jgi:hypothetical protein
MPIGRAQAAARPGSSSQAGAWLFLAALVAVGCNKTESCRSGTLFLNVGLGAYANVDELDVDVAVADGSGGGGPRHTVLTLKPGHTSGGVEVDFPDGYPTDKSVTVTLTLRSMGLDVAQRVSTIAALPPGCTAVSVDFAATDGGGGGVAGTAGAGGRGGAGTTGAAGQGGLAGGGGSAGTSGATGSGGQAGAAGGVTGAAGGKAGAGGGKAGTGGGAAGTSGGGAGGAPCVPTGAEDCFNGKDDDCDGKIDCADPDCTPTAQCVTADPTAAPIGLLTGTGPCPTAGYGDATKVMSGPNTLTCTGCGCKAPTAVTCTTTLTSYNTTALCEADSTVVEKAGTFSTGDDKSCTVIPPWSINPSGDIFGIVTTKFTAAVAAGCTATGAPVIPTLTWSSNGTFCATSSIGGGCGAGQVCVPSAGGGSPCQLFDGNKTSCPGGAQPLPWYTGTSGTASCGACSCGAATGAGCDNVTLSVGSEYTCSGSGSIASGGSLCFASGIYEPGVQFTGTPTAPSCQASSPYTGNLAAAGPKTLCCP